MNQSILDTVELDPTQLFGYNITHFGIIYYIKQTIYNTQYIYTYSLYIYV